jgi:hypothetical protein
MNQVVKVSELQDSEAKEQLILVLNLLYDSQLENIQNSTKEFVDVTNFGVLAHNLSSGPMIMTKIPDRLDVFFLLRRNKITINKPNTGTDKEEEFIDRIVDENSSLPFYPSMFQALLEEINVE